MAMSTFLLSSLSPYPNPPQSPISRNPIFPLEPNVVLSRRLFIFTSTSLSSVLSFALQSQHLRFSSASETPLPPPPQPSSILSGIVNTKSWFQFYGDGFAIRVPPEFEDILEPETRGNGKQPHPGMLTSFARLTRLQDYNAGLSLYGDKAKPRIFSARFASSDGSEVVSVVTRPSNQLKITFLEAKDITDFGSLKEAARIFVPNGATLYSARTIKVKEDEGLRTYYFYEFGRNEQHVALVAAVNSGKVVIAGATAPQSKWDDDGVKLRSAAISLTVL